MTKHKIIFKLLYTVDLYLSLNIFYSILCKLNRCNIDINLCFIKYLMVIKISEASAIYFTNYCLSVSEPGLKILQYLVEVKIYIGNLFYFIYISGKII